MNIYNLINFTKDLNFPSMLFSFIKCVFQVSFFIQDNSTLSFKYLIVSFTIVFLTH